MSIVARLRRLLGMKIQIPVPEDDGFRPSTYSEGYGLTGNSAEAGDAESTQLPRCDSRKREGSRSWRCTKNSGHENQPKVWVDQWHENAAGGRRW